MEAFLTDWVDGVLSAFLDPKKRVFCVYLLCALAIGLVWLRAQGLSLREACKEIFSNRVWWCRSSRADYLIVIINQAVMQVLTPVIVTQLAVATFLFYKFHGITGGNTATGLTFSNTTVAVVFTSALFVLDDYSKFWLHRALHRFPCLWAFHKVHHTATVLTPLTVYRTHPVEGLLFSIRSAVVQGIAIATFISLFPGQVSLVTVLGANVFVVVFNVIGANLRHSQISLPYPRVVECVFMSPAQHQIHHSMAKVHHDRNFGVALSLWDSLAGTMSHSEANKPLRFGIAGQSVPHSLQAIYILPCAEAFAAARSGGRSALARLFEKLPVCRGRDRSAVD